MATRWTVLLLSCAVFAGCSTEEADTPEEIAARTAPAESSEAPPAAPQKMVENVEVSDMTPQAVPPSTLKPVAETERAEITRPAETPALPLPATSLQAQTEPKEPAPKAEDPKPAAEPKPRDSWGPFAALDEEPRRNRRRNRSSGGRSGPVTITVPPPFVGGLGGSFGGNGSGSGSGGAGFGSESIEPPDFGSYAPDGMSDGAEFASGTPLSGYEIPGGTDLPMGPASGGAGGGYYPPGYGDEFDLTGDDLAGATDGYFPPGSGPTGGHDGPRGPNGGHGGPSDGGLQPTPPIPPPDF